MLGKRTLAGQMNATEASTTVNNIRKDPPKITAVTFTKETDKTAYAADGSWSTQNLVHAITATYDGPGEIHYQYEEENGSPVATSQTATWSSEMNKEIRFRAYDDTENYGDWTGYYTLKIDKSAPTQTSYSGGFSGTWKTANYAVTLSATDNMSGIARYEYSINGTSGWATIASPYTYSTEGNYNHYYRAVNNAGLAGAASAVNNIKLDKTAPSVPTVTGGTR